jgi:hypothetical protein
MNTSNEIRELYGLNLLLSKYQRHAEPFWLIKLKMENKLSQITKNKRETSWLDKPIQLGYLDYKFGTAKNG